MLLPITQFTIQNYACLRDVTVELTALHAFIGPNDSGKSTLLRAVRTVVELMRRGFKTVGTAGDMHIEPFDPGLIANRHASFRVSLSQTESYGIDDLDGDGFFEALEPRHSKHIEFDRAGEANPGGDDFVRVLDGVARNRVLAIRRGARLIRFDPDALRQPGLPIPDAHRSAFTDERGLGLPGILDAILNRGDDTFLRMVEQVRALFPNVRHVRLRVNPQHAKELEIELVDGTRVPPAFISEGLLYYLGFLALQHLEPAPSILLVEEPENGLHPARIVEVMKLLRKLSETTQILIATHSPLVINELAGDEISVVTRHPARGTQVTRLSATPNYKERSEVYANGELWVSYADGIEEAPLLGSARNEGANG